MTPSADPANAVTADGSVVERYLQDGEIVILAIKPSGWFVLITSWPVLVVAALVGAASVMAGDMFNISGSSEALLLGCLACGFIRLLAASLQWGGRLYILTNRRVMQFRGIAKVEMYPVPLKQISEVLLSASTVESFFQLGSIYFNFFDAGTPQSNWTHLNNPGDVRRAILEAISHCR